MTDDLTTYLSDHLAGATAGVELAGHLVELFAGSDREGTLRQLQADIEADRDELRSLIERLGAGESTVRKIGAWLAEKAAELKLKFDDPESGDFARFEALEALSLGIEGKRCLWLALSSAGESNISIEMDLSALIRRAEAQRAVVETLRLEFASRALSAGASIHP